MNYKTIFLVMINLLLVAYILYNFLSIRNQLTFNLNICKPDISLKTEGFSFITRSCSNELLNIMVSTPTLITNCRQTQYSINQYCIKSSYNSGYTGSCMNIDMIPYLLKRGVRFLDFGVYGTTIPMVANSSDISGNDSLYLQDVFNTIIQNAFNSTTSPNWNDPLFIQLRVYTSDNKLYNNIGSVIYNTLLNRLYVKINALNQSQAIQVNGNTKLSNILGKIIIVMDNSIFPTFSKYTICDNSNNTTNCYNLENFINIYSGTNEIITQTYGNIINQTTTPPILHNNKSELNICSGYNNGPLNLKMAVPDITDAYLDLTVLFSFIKNYGVQIVLFSFYNSMSVEEYENIFENGGSAFSLLSTSIRYINNSSPNTISSVFSINEG
jgi:hypothetical protein